MTPRGGPGSGPEFAELVRARTTRVGLIGNGVGALVVFLFGVVAPVQPESDPLLQTLLNLGVFIVFMAFALPLGLRWGIRAGEPILRWLSEDRPVTEAERGLALRYPLVLVRISAVIWGAAAVVFTGLNAIDSTALAATIGVVVVLGGVTTCAVGYLLAERVGRPVVARALAGGPPPRAVGPGVAARLTMAWVLATGVPVLGIAAMAFADVVGAELQEETAAWATLLLALTTLLVGLLAIVMASRSVAEPLAAVRGGMERVEKGDFDARVSVDDAGELGVLEAGFNRMAVGLSERERLRDLFGRHVGRDVARAALDSETRLGGEVRDVAALFVDVVGSTSLAASRPPAAVVALLNEFFRVVVQVVERHGGWVNKFEGDAALCVFGAPIGGTDPAGGALAAARELHERLAAELEAIDYGIGVSAGPAVAGNVGAEERFEYTVIGDPVNEAARLCELAKQRPERVLASERALERSGEGERSRWGVGDSVTLRGREGSTRLAAPSR